MIELTLSEYTKCALEQFDTTINKTNMLDGHIPACEALNILNPALDILSRTFYNATTILGNIFKGRDFKRSELRAYYESHKFSVNGLLVNKAIDLGPRKVASPRGMIATYQDTSAMLNAYLTKTALPATIKTTRIMLTDTTIASSKINPDILNKSGDIIGRYANTISKVSVKEVSNKLAEAFTPSNTLETVSCSKIIPTHSSLVAAFNSILAFEQHYHDAMDLTDRIESINKNIGRLVDTLQGSGFIDSRVIRVLHLYVHTLATQIDVYGTLLGVCQNVEHSFTHAINQLRA